MRGMATDRQEQKSVLYKYLLWAVVIVWEGSEGVGFDRCINFAIPLQPKDLAPVVCFPPRRGKSALSSLSPMVCTSEKTQYLQGRKQRETLANSGFLYYNNSMRAVSSPLLTPS